MNVSMNVCVIGGCVNNHVCVCVCVCVCWGRGGYFMVFCGI